MLPSKRANPSSRQEDIKTSASPEPPMEVVETPPSGKSTPEGATGNGEVSADAGGKPPKPSGKPPPSSGAAPSGPHAKDGKEGVRAGSSGPSKVKGGAVSKPESKLKDKFKHVTSKITYH